MTRLLNPNSAYPCLDAKKILMQQLQNILVGPALPKNRIIRIELPIRPIDALRWLSSQTDTTKIYWSNRDGNFEVAGIGLAYALHGTRTIEFDAIFYELERYLTPENRFLKFFGGTAFQSNSLDKSWEPFGSYRFILPRFEILRRNEEMFLACNVFADETRKGQITSVLSLLETLDFSPTGKFSGLPLPINRRDEPTKEQWMSDVEKVISTLGQATLQKVVLARKSTFEFSQLLDPVTFITHLKKISPECFHFCFQFDDHAAFLGASPERLFKRDGKIIKSEALAGTRPRGNSKSENHKLGEELLNSHKERREHILVVEAIKENLKAMCASVETESGTSLLSLSGGQHLLTCLEGLLSDETDDAAILKQLHPTPAVGGFPTANALKVIEKFEPFKRGWYAGPVGCVGYGSAEFAVAIRCGLIRGNQLSLFAGAGIVQGSSPQNEWNEIETKISNFIEIFQNGQPKIP